ncbi:MAG: dihydroorotase [Candidatus Melainabacteria bacterium]|nr:dihydroorotase [Candidatus Melainabacteria bacterium]
MRILLKGGRVLDPATGLDQVADLLINNSQIEAIGANLPETDVDRVVRLNPNLWVTPGLVDIHVHFREPGQVHKETLATGAKAAVAGGFTSVCLMPNTQPTIDDLPSLEYLNLLARQQRPVNLYPVAAITKNIAGETLTEFGILQAHGAVAFTDDGHGLANSVRMRRALELVRPLGVPIICHAEDPNLSCDGCMNEGLTATLLGLPGIPNEAESVMIARDIQLVRRTGGRVHFTHVSCKESVDLIRQAKAEGLPVTMDVTPHHLTLTDRAVADMGYDTNLKMNPPLRSEADRQALIAALQDGTIDAIATDHAPHTPDDKSVTFDVAPCGVIGLETALGVILTHFYQTGLLSPLEIIRRMSTEPARLMQLPAGTLAVGAAADVTVIDPSADWLVMPELFESKSRNCPFNGHMLKGKATMVFASGQCLLGADRMQPSDPASAPLLTSPMPA